MANDIIDAGKVLIHLNGWKQGQPPRDNFYYLVLYHMGDIPSIIAWHDRNQEWVHVENKGTHNTYKKASGASVFYKKIDLPVVQHKGEGNGKPTRT